ncbi:MAG: hypothetical protein WBN40_11040 [Pseudomonadales bacterium]
MIQVDQLSLFARILLAVRSLFLVFLILIVPNVHAFQYEEFDDNQIPATDWDQQDRAAIQAGSGSYAIWSTQADPLNLGGYLYRIESNRMLHVIRRYIHIGYRWSE